MGEILRQNYSETLRNFELLKGSSVGFILLAIGTLLDSSNMRGYEAIVFMVFFAAIGLSVLSLVFAHRAVIKPRRISEVAINEKN